MIKNRRTYLRALEIDDYQTTLKWHNDDEIWPSVVGPKYFVSAEYEKKWIEAAIFSKDSVKLAICLIESHQMIGIASLTEFDWINHSAGFSIMIGEKNLWGQGYASEAVIQLLEFAFQERGLHRISGPILESNQASRSVCKKCGLKEEGLLRDAVFRNGRYQNLVVVSILRDEFLETLAQYEQ
jgi:RimJ/RimL family protein N-acetyltransferase